MWQEEGRGEKATRGCENSDINEKRDICRVCQELTFHCAFHCVHHECNGDEEGDDLLCRPGGNRNQTDVTIKVVAVKCTKK